MHVGEQKPFDERHAGEPNCERLADDAVGTVRADHPAGIDFVAVVEAHGHTVGSGVESADAMAPLDRSAEFGQPLAQRGFDLGLRDDQAGPPAEPLHGESDLQPGQLTARDGDHHLVDRQRTLGQVAKSADPVENLHTPRLQAQRPRRHRRADGGVEHPHRDAGLAQPARHRQPRRTRSHHNDWGHSPRKLGPHPLAGDGFHVHPPFSVSQLTC